MLKNEYSAAKIGASTAENGAKFAKLFTKMFLFRSTKREPTSFTSRSSPICESSEISEDPLFCTAVGKSDTRL